MPRHQIGDRRNLYLLGIEKNVTVGREIFLQVPGQALYGRGIRAVPFARKYHHKQVVGAYFPAKDQKFFPVLKGLVLDIGFYF